MSNNANLNNSVITKKARFTENLHIVFWLLKDIGWCLNFKVLALLMAVPTLVLAIHFLVKHKQDISECYHNLAVSLWILANSWWMCAEFFSFDEKILLIGLTGRNLAAFPFGLGILILCIFYLIIFPKNKKKLFD